VKPNVLGPFCQAQMVLSETAEFKQKFTLKRFKVSKTWLNISHSQATDGLPYRFFDIIVS
jgi:hypothetical protein